MEFAISAITACLVFLEQMNLHGKSRHHVRFTSGRLLSESQDDSLITDELRINDYRKFLEAVKSKIGNG
jgi:hypothetical protein